MPFNPKNYLAVFALLGLLIFFYPAVFLVQAAPLLGDSLEQHYPWALHLAQSLKNFKLPFWTTLVQCGFPLVAESQIGAFYIPNLVLYGLLPFKVAYSYMNLFHWFMAGWGMFLYSRQMKLDALPSFVASVIFVFGAAYGGAYYNMTSLKTICWFPLALYLLERYLEKQKIGFLAVLALVISQSLVAGYLQMSILTWLIFGIYTVLRIFIFAEKKINEKKKTIAIGMLIGTAFVALILASPQIYLSFQNAMVSNRVGLEEEYAYLGSMSPLVFLTMIFPKFSLILRSNNIYNGFFTLFLITFAFSSEVRKNKTFQLWAVMTIIAALLALGRWSPLYVALIKITQFYSFRFPVKFIGFICFGFAMLAAIGFQALWKGKWSQGIIKTAVRRYTFIVGGFVALMFIGNVFLSAGRNFAFKVGDFYVNHFIYGKPGHSHSLEYYLTRIRNYPDYALGYISFQDPANLWTIAMILFSVGLLNAFLFKKITMKSLLRIGLIFLIVDLYFASYHDIQLDLEKYKKALKPSPLTRALEVEKSAGELGRVYSFRLEGKKLPYTPSQNMLYGIEELGMYSPFVFKKYNETIGLLGNVNDSNYQYFPNLPDVLTHLPLLDFLNVSHILSSEVINHKDLKLIKYDQKEGSYLYKNQRDHQLAYFLGKVITSSNWTELREKLMTPHFNPKETLLIEREELNKVTLNEIQTNPKSSITLEAREDDFEKWNVQTDQAGFFVISETYFPGWTATVDNEPVSILKAYGLFRAIWISGPGRYTIQFKYKPFSHFFV